MGAPAARGSKAVHASTGIECPVPGVRRVRADQHNVAVLRLIPRESASSVTSLVAAMALAALVHPVPLPADAGDDGTVIVSVVVRWAIGWDNDVPTSFGPKERPAVAMLDVDGVEYEIAAMSL